ncbi:MAG: 16S rRNA (cytidine(1402)-2'-O)-methyltransferase, partial [Actinomycetes bacterium]
RIGQSLKDAQFVFGDRRASVSRELTKKFEQTVRGTLSELATWAEEEPRGEIVLVISGATEVIIPDVHSADLLGEVGTLKTSGLSLKQSVAVVAAKHSVSKSELYQAVLDNRTKD